MRTYSITFQHLYGLGISHVSNTEITGLAFAESLEVLVMTLEELHEKTKPRRL